MTQNILLTPKVDYSQMLYVYWKSPLYIENRDDPTTYTKLDLVVRLYFNLGSVKNTFLLLLPSLLRDKVVVPVRRPVRCKIDLRDLLGMVSNMLDCDIVVSMFELQSRYYVHFRTNALGKGMNLIIPSAIG